MPRQARLDAPGVLHHVMGRGIEGTKIFRNDTDRGDFLRRLGDLCLDGKLIVYAWALMPNHFHLLVRTARQPLAKSMRQLLTGYVVNFNRRHRRRGHLFQNRYRSIICEDDPYLLELTRYIHLNPLRAGFVDSLETLRGYAWSGHSAILGHIKRAWQDTDNVLSYFGSGRRAAIDEYERFVLEGIVQGRRPELVGGGLVRSSGGWFQVLSLRGRGERVAGDERILGGGDFVQAVLSEAQERARETLRLSSKVPDLTTLAKRISEMERVDEAALRSGSRLKRVVRARKTFCQLAVRKMGYPGAEVARFLGVSTSAVNRAAAPEEPDARNGLVQVSSRTSVP